MGLGKTTSIIQGFFLGQKLANRTIKTFLIIVPSSLVDQWIQECRDMFQQIQKGGLNIWNIRYRILAQKAWIFEEFLNSHQDSSYSDSWKSQISNMKYKPLTKTLNE
eukprot:gene11593-14197_t